MGRALGSPSKSGWPSNAHITTWPRKKRDLEPLFPIWRRLGKAQEVRNGRVGCGVAGSLMAQAVPEQRDGNILVPVVRQLAQHLGNIPVQKRVVQLVPEVIR